MYGDVRGDKGGRIGRPVLVTPLRTACTCAGGGAEVGAGAGVAAVSFAVVVGGGVGIGRGTDCCWLLATSRASHVAECSPLATVASVGDTLHVGQQICSREKETLPIRHMRRGRLHPGMEQS